MTSPIPDRPASHWLVVGPKLLEACKAVLASMNDTDLEGIILWINPPYQNPAVHETAQERLQAAIDEAEGTAP